MPAYQNERLATRPFWLRQGEPSQSPGREFTRQNKSGERIASAFSPTHYKGSQSQEVNWADISGKFKRSVGS